MSVYMVKYSEKEILNLVSLEFRSNKRDILVGVIYVISVPE